MEHDHPELIQAPLTLMGSPFDFETHTRAPVVPDKPDLKSEIIDDHDPINSFYNAMLNYAPDVEVERLMDVAIDELRQDLAKYREQTAGLAGKSWPEVKLEPGLEKRVTQITQGMHKKK